MKKIKIISLLLCLMLLLQSAAMPALAVDTQTGELTVPEATEDPNKQLVIPFGQVSVINGCRTIEAMNPLAGSARMLPTAQAALVYEVDTGTMIYSYNPDMEMHPGTLAKVVTALVAIEHCELDDVVTVSSRNISKLPAGSQHADLKEAEQLSVKDLLYCLIHKSANDAAIALAEHVSTSMDKFVELMNERVAQIGCTGTVFTNVHGLLNNGGETAHTTARDMAKIVVEATKNETFKELFGAMDYTVPATNRSEERYFRTLNYLINDIDLQKYYYEAVTGGYASYINEFTGASIVATANKNNINVVCVILGATRVINENGWRVESYGNFDEMVQLLKFTYDGYKVNNLLYDGMALEQFSVSGGESNVIGQPHVNIDTVLPNDVTMSNLIVKRTEMGGGLTAPIQMDDKIATVEVWYRNCCLAETELYAMNPVRSAANSGLDVQSIGTRDDSDVSEFMGIIGVVVLIVLVPMVIYLAVNAFRRARAQARRRRRRASRRRSR